MKTYERLKKEFVLSPELVAGPSIYFLKFLCEQFDCLEKRLEIIERQTYKPTEKDYDG